jgi:hypothetical protein
MWGKKKMADKSPELRIQFTKRPDGTVVLRCVRGDGSVTWQRHEKHATFFSYHDLTHFAVETTLGFRAGFYGLIADGWDITDTTGKGARGKLSANSIFVEHVVGLLDRERSGGAAPLTAVEFNLQIDEMLGKDLSRTPFTEAQLTAVRTRIEELHQEWARVSPGSSFELLFDRSSVEAVRTLPAR